MGGAEAGIAVWVVAAVFGIGWYLGSRRVKDVVLERPADSSRQDLTRALAILTERCNVVDASAKVTDLDALEDTIRGELDAVRVVVEAQAKAGPDAPLVAVMQGEIDFLRRICFEQDRHRRAAEDPMAFQAATPKTGFRGASSPEPAPEKERSRPGPLRPLPDVSNVYVPPRPITTARGTVEPGRVPWLDGVSPGEDDGGPKE